VDRYWNGDARRKLRKKLSAPEANLLEVGRQTGLRNQKTLEALCLGTDASDELRKDAANRLVVACEQEGRLWRLGDILSDALSDGSTDYRSTRNRCLRAARTLLAVSIAASLVIVLAVIVLVPAVIFWWDFPGTRAAALAAALLLFLWLSGVAGSWALLRR